MGLAVQHICAARGQCSKRGPHLCTPRRCGSHPHTPAGREHSRCAQKTCKGFTKRYIYRKDMPSCHCGVAASQMANKIYDTCSQPVRVGASVWRKYCHETTHETDTGRGMHTVTSPHTCPWHTRPCLCRASCPQPGMISTNTSMRKTCRAIHDVASQGSHDDSLHTPSTTPTDPTGLCSFPSHDRRVTFPEEEHVGGIRGCSGQQMCARSP